MTLNNRIENQKRSQMKHDMYSNKQQQIKKQTKIKRALTKSVILFFSLNELRIYIEQNKRRTQI
jgi:hypothetical protein